MRHFSKYLGKSFLMQSNLNSFSSVFKQCSIVNYNLMIVMPEEK